MDIFLRSLKLKKCGMIKYLILFFFICFNCLGQREAFFNTFSTLDNETQFSVRNYTGYRQSIDSICRKRKTFVGITSGLRYYDAYNSSTNFSELKFLINSKINKNVEVLFNQSVVYNKKWSPYVYEFLTTYKHKHFYLEAFSERDLLGVSYTNEKKVLSNFHGLSLDYNLPKRITIVNSINYNKITDGNDRWFYLNRIIYTTPNEKFIFDVRTRLMWGGERSEYYFSPNKIKQFSFGFGWREFVLNKIYVSSYLGLGRQIIDDQTQGLIIADLKLKRKLTNKVNMDLFLGVRNFNSYIYGFGQAKLSINL